MSPCRACGVAHDPLRRCEDPRNTVHPVIKRVVTRNQSAVPVVTRNQCAECAAKDILIADLRRQLAEPKSKPKRDRAEYMRKRRAAGKS